MAGNGWKCYAYHYEGSRETFKLINMAKKALLVDFNICVRIIIDEDEENLETVLTKAKPKVQSIIDSGDLGENLAEWYEDLEVPYDKSDEVLLKDSQ